MILNRPDHPKVLKLFKLLEGSVDLCLSSFFSYTSSVKFSIKIIGLMSLELCQLVFLVKSETERCKMHVLSILLQLRLT